eukprot:CAMPEP_0181391866 /NCGR_PEP_ID=MMETSP1106-20121128/26276_1 /TAXON_ID=81844 /ORGANISM="Mantoniella antarctica, Strain SL-175" /LENGTH=591 /DNA_ID=CAMNT_0023512931 /DNA_START=136 /DNA_END=1910 /DNA_ORIENTATION=-
MAETGAGNGGGSDDAAIAHMLMQEEMAAADAACGGGLLPHIPQEEQEAVHDETPDYSPGSGGSKRKKPPKSGKPPKPKPEPPRATQPKPSPEPEPPRAMQPKPSPEVLKRQPGRVRSGEVGGGGGSTRGVTLAHLIDAGRLKPGVGVLTTQYNDVRVVADLLPDGSIAWNGRTFGSVSAFSLTVKRSVNPSRKADDGWKCVKCDGAMLDIVKKSYEEDKAVGGGKSDQGAAAGGEGREGDPAGGGGGEVETAGSAGTAGLQTAEKAAHKAAHKAAALRQWRRSQGGGCNDSICPSQGRAGSEAEAQAAAKAQAAAQAPTGEETEAEATAKVKAKAKAGGAMAPEGDGPTLARSRPQRERRPPPPRGLLPGAATSGGDGDLQMVECERYRGGEPGSDAGAQPWTLTLTSAAALVMDFHAHLCSTEIIGFLGGTWDAAARTLHVMRALPARRLLLAGAGEDSSVEVELDPASVPEIVDTLHTAGLKVVGWYHSHPVFFTHPSIRDIENQANYQSLFKRGDENEAGGAGGGERPRGESKREEGENEGSAGVREEGGGSGGEEGGLGSNAGGVGGRARGRSQSTAAPFVACIVGP